MKLEKGNVFQYVEDGYSFTVTDVEVNIGNPIGVTVKVNVEYSDGTTGVSFAEHIHLLLRGGDLKQVIGTELNQKYLELAQERISQAS